MTKAELASLISNKIDITKKDSYAYLNAFCDAIYETVMGGEEVKLSGLGTFTLKEVKTKNTINPRTKKVMNKVVNKKIAFHTHLKAAKV